MIGALAIGSSLLAILADDDEPKDIEEVFLRAFAFGNPSILLDRIDHNDEDIKALFLWMARWSQQAMNLVDLQARIDFFLNVIYRQPLSATVGFSTNITEFLEPNSWRIDHWNDAIGGPTPISSKVNTQTRVTMNSAVLPPTFGGKKVVLYNGDLVEALSNKLKTVAPFIASSLGEFEIIDTEGSGSKKHLDLAPDYAMSWDEDSILFVMIHEEGYRTQIARRDLLRSTPPEVLLTGQVPSS